MDSISSSCQAHTAEPDSKSALRNEPANHNGVIQVWIVPFAELRKHSAQPHRLSTDERNRASKMAGTKKARDYILARSFLRSILASRMNCMPLDVDIQYTMNEKPFVKNGPAFNLSHCEKLLVAAVADYDFIGQIGVDVETRVTDPDYLRLADTCFTQSERNQLALFKTGVSRQHAFTRGWTRKEAVVKAIGTGLQAPLNCFDVSLKCAEKQEQFGRSMVRQSMLLGSRLQAVSLQKCGLYDLGSFLDCEVSLAVVNAVTVGSVVHSSVVRVHKVDEHQISSMAGYAHG